MKHPSNLVRDMIGRNDIDNIHAQRIGMRLRKKRDQKIAEGMDYVDATNYASNRWSSGLVMGFKKKRAIKDQRFEDEYRGKNE